MTMRTIPSRLAYVADAGAGVPVLAKGGTGKVYAETDPARNNELTVYNKTGQAVPPPNSNVHGQIPDFYVDIPETDMGVYWYDTISGAMIWLPTKEGTRGYSAFEVAKRAGFTGTETQWVASLKAPAENAAAAATSAASEATAVAQDLETRLAAGEFKGEKGDTGLPGPNAVANDVAFAAALETPGTETNRVVNATIASEGANHFAPIAGGSRPTFRRHIPQVVSAFQAGHSWIAVSGGGTTTLNDTTEYYAGTQSVRLVTNGAGTSQIIGATVPTIPAGHFYRLWVKIAAPETVTRVRLFASTDAGFLNYYSIEKVISSAGTAEVLRKWKAGEWVPIDMPLTDATVTGTPDPGALPYLRVLVNDRNVVATVNVGRLDYVPFPATAFPNGVISLTYDDSHAAAYTVARTELARYGYTATLFPIIERIDQPGYLTTAQLRSLVLDYGWEIGGHATTYAKHVKSVDGMTVDELRAELGGIRAWMQSNGFNATSFAYPNGRFNLSALGVVGEYFSTARMATGSYQELQHAGSLPLRIYSGNAGTMTMAALQAEVDRAVANKTWLVLMFHDIVDPEGTSNDLTPAQHTELLAYIASKGAACRSMQEVLRAYAA